MTLCILEDALALARRAVAAVPQSDPEYLHGLTALVGVPSVHRHRQFHPQHADIDKARHRLLTASARRRGSRLSDLLGPLQRGLSDNRDDIALIAFRADPPG
ncbi:MULTISPECIES: hypothetical protein [Streptomyces]|uniref:Uncharacterized protein n=1 Tax=Streptomyces rubrogriseus TaxID=194673 RepID=A0ABT4P417_9ACTN|nr:MULTISPECIES: hypothetical protein [Streptomyces]MCW8123166.1 hypothetical protein [Streptomyces anthocyanicus]MCZ4635116.1 hypothetical protein [Streptomyces rubrogriseus]MDX3317693.1 hypothetical protein [Streptomyces sp. ME03-5684b]WTE17640.1 hypothetical protein OH747_08525 [Streptomyces anthocyanicus]